jgi:outer membrane protein
MPGMKSSLLAISIVLALAAPAAAQKIGFVDMQRVLDSSNEGKAAVTKLRTEHERRGKELEAQRVALVQTDAELAKKAPNLTKEELAKQRQDLNTKMAALQEASQKAERELRELEAKLTDPIVGKAQRAVAAIAQRDRYAFVLRREAVLWPMQSEHDLTNEVIRKVNEDR